MALPTGAHRGRHEVGGATVADEGLGPVHHVVLTIFDGPRPDGAHIAARVRLGDAECADAFTGNGGTKERFFLLWRACAVDDLRGELRMSQDADGDPHCSAPHQLLDEHRRVPEVETTSAVLFGEPHPEKAQAPQA